MTPGLAVDRSRTTASGVTTPVAMACTDPEGTFPSPSLPGPVALWPRSSLAPAGPDRTVAAVDIDRFLADNRGTWDRLHELTGRATHLSGAEVRELSRLHQRAAGQLAYAQAHFSDPGVGHRSPTAWAASAAVLYGTRRHTWRTVGRFFSVTFPMAVWDARWFLLVSGVALFLPAVVIGTWIAHSHAALDVTAPPAVRAAYVNHDFASYYSSEPSAAFAGRSIRTT